MPFLITRLDPDARRTDRRTPVRIAASAVAGLATAAALIAAPLAASADDATTPAVDPIVVEADPAETSAAPTPDQGARNEASAEGGGDASQTEAVSGPGPAEEPAQPARAEELAGSEPAEAAVEPAADAEGGSTPAESQPVSVDAAAARTPDGVAPAAEDANTPPVAVADAFQTVQDTPLVVDAPGLQMNDFDPDGDYIFGYGLDPWVPEEWSGNADGSFVYTPPAGFVGTRVLEYTIRDAHGAVSAPARITIDVLPAGSEVNGHPVAEDDEYWYASGTPLYIAPSGVLANDADPDGDVLTTSLQDWPGVGAVEVGTDGSFLFTPAPGTGGSRWFVYRVCDAERCADGEVWLHEAGAGQGPSGPAAAPEEPAEPMDPTEPTDPGDPTDPTDPTDPADPADPADADDSAPGKPSSPAAPSVLADPARPAASRLDPVETDASPTSALARTGTDPGSALALASLLAATGIALRYARRRATG